VDQQGSKAQEGSAGIKNIIKKLLEKALNIP